MLQGKFKAQIVAVNIFEASKMVHINVILPKGYFHLYKVSKEVFCSICKG